MPRIFPFVRHSKSSSSKSSPFKLRSFRSLDGLNRITNIDISTILKAMLLSVKSNYGFEYRRFHVEMGTGIDIPTYEEFLEKIQDLHNLTEEQKKTTYLCYFSKEGTTLPISNDDNLRKALEERPATLRILLRNKGEFLEEQYGYGLATETMERRKNIPTISSPQDFRRVSSILDADSLPLELRRVQLCKAYGNKPLGFFIRDGYSTRMCQWGPVQVPSIFISRLLPNGLAASTNLLNVNDEILEVNGIELANKTLDQVTDIMTANATNLILTIRPAVFNQYQFMPFMGYTAPPPAYNFPPPGYCNSLPFPPGSPLAPQQQYYSYTGFPGSENVDRRRQSPWNTFSRESTWRLSDKKTPCSTLEDRRRPRPFSVHCPPAHQMYPIPYTYGY